MCFHCFVSEPVVLRPGICSLPSSKTPHKGICFGLIRCRHCPCLGSTYQKLSQRMPELCNCSVFSYLLCGIKFRGPLVFYRFIFLASSSYCVCILCCWLLLICCFDLCVILSCKKSFKLSLYIISHVTSDCQADCLQVSV